LRDKAATGRVDKRLALVGGASALAPCRVINDDDGGLVADTVSVGLETLLKGGDILDELASDGEAGEELASIASTSKACRNFTKSFVTCVLS